MNIKEYFDKIDFSEIQSLVDNKQEENIFIEFKTVNHPNYNDKNKNFDKEHLSKCLSGFANSSGGILIWGIKADKDSNGIDCANELKPIQQLTKLLNMFNSLEGQAVTPTISGVEYKKIDTGNDTGYIVTYVPESESRPHMANFADKHYYKRNGDSFYKGEHYDIVDMFARRKQPKLRLETKNIIKQAVHRTFWRFELVFAIINDSKAIAKFPYLAMNVSHPFGLADFGLDGNGFTGLQRTKNSLTYSLNYTGGGDIVIHPQMTLDIDKLRGEIRQVDEPLDLIIDYLIMAENMDPIQNKIVISKEDLMR